MSYTKSAFCLLLALTSVQGAWGFFCYGHIMGTEGTTWVFCPSTSCYTVGMSILGIGDSRRGCADKIYEDGCHSAKAIVASGNVCFCNRWLCNYSSAGNKSLYLPLLILPYVIHKFL